MYADALYKEHDCACGKLPFGVCGGPQHSFPNENLPHVRLRIRVIFNFKCAIARLKSWLLPCMHARQR